MLTIEGLAMAGLGPPGGVPAAQGGTPQVDFATLLAAAAEAPAAITPPGYGVPLMSGAALDGQALPSPQIEAASASPSTSALVELLTIPEPVPPGANASIHEGTPRPDRTSEATVSEEDHSTEELLAAALAASVALAPPHLPQPVTPLAVSSAAPPVIAISASAAEVATSEWSTTPREALPAAEAPASAVNVAGLGAGLAPAVAARAAESAATRVEPSATGSTGTASENASAAPVPEAASDASAGQVATSGAALIDGGTNTLRPAGLPSALPSAVPSDSPSAEAGDVSTSTPPAAASAQPRDASNGAATGATDAPGIATMGRALASPVADRAQADAPAPPPDSAGVTPDSAPQAPAPATNDAPVSAPVVAVALEAAPGLEEDTTRATVVDSPLDAAEPPAGTTEAASSDAALVNDPAALGSIQRTDSPVAANTAAAPAVDSTDRAALQARLADSVLAAARSDASVRLVLNPPELGHLEVRVERHEQGLRVELVTATADAADLIKQQLPALVSGLEARSVRVDQAEVRQAPPAGSTAFSLGSDAHQAGADTSGSGRQWERPDWSEAARIEQESTAPRTNRPRNGLLDMVA